MTLERSVVHTYPNADYATLITKNGTAFTIDATDAEVVSQYTDWTAYDKPGHLYQVQRFNGGKPKTMYLTRVLMNAQPHQWVRRISGTATEYYKRCFELVEHRRTPTLNHEQCTITVNDDEPIHCGAWDMTLQTNPDRTSLLVEVAEAALDMEKAIAKYKTLITALDNE